MKTKIKLLTLSAIAALVALVVGCSDDVTLDSGEATSREIFFTFEVYDLDSAETKTATKTATKALTDTSDDSDIQNMWVVQLDDSDAQTSSPVYYSTFSTTDGIYVDAATTQVLFLANTFDSDLISSTATLADIKALYKAITTHDDVLSTDPAATTSQYCIMSDIVPIDATTGAGEIVLLRRNFAKINIQIVNSIETSSGVSGYSVTNIETLNIPDASYYYTDYIAEGDLFPADADLSLTDDHTWTSDERTAAASSAGNTFYLPVNMRGTSLYSGYNTDSEYDTSYKSYDIYIPTGSTAIRITLANSDDTDTRRYTFYLGANMTNDYNLAPNSLYNYTFTITQLGDNDDPRIEIEYTIAVGAWTDQPVTDGVYASDYEDGLDVDDYTGETFAEDVSEVDVVTLVTADNYATLLGEDYADAVGCYILYSVEVDESITFATTSLTGTDDLYEPIDGYGYDENHYKNSPVWPKLLVAAENASDSQSWTDADNNSATYSAYGYDSGWRLPTFTELYLVYIYDIILTPTSSTSERDYYWTATRAYDSLGDYDMFVLSLSETYGFFQMQNTQSAPYKIRYVRELEVIRQD